MNTDDLIIQIGDCRETLKKLENQSVNTVVTSPPYFGLRDYGNEGQLGLEASPDDFVQALVEVFREVRRVLRDDGTVWLNLGDSYAAQRGGTHQPAETLAGGVGGKTKAGERVNRSRHDGYNPTRNASAIGLKHKDLIGIPWRVAFALQADGWYLRQDIIWHKPNPMPESVRDRCTKSHEYIFLLSKSPKYYYDHEASKEDAVGGQSGKAASFKRTGSKREQTIPNQSKGTHRPDREDKAYNGEKRNRRSVWTVPTRPYKGAHFATFPADLITPCILAGCPEGGVVLDPFGGSGTTAGVALANKRKAVICELNENYLTLMDERIKSILANRIKLDQIEYDKILADLI